MTPKIVLIPLALAFASGIVLSLLSATSGSTDFEAREGTRIRAHLARVEAELSRRDVSELSPAQRRARASHLAVLHRYQERGRFPRNLDFPDQRVPYFVDRHGTRCAVAWLIEHSGRGDLVARVAATANHARITDLDADPELRAWLTSAGLTLDEAARIQPSYDHEGRANGVVRYVGTCVLVDVGQIAIISSNSRRGDPWPKRRVRGAVGILGGVAGIMIGTVGIPMFDPATMSMGAVTIALSATAVGFSLRNLSTPTSDAATIQSAARGFHPAFFIRSRSREAPQLAVRVAF